MFRGITGNGGDKHVAFAIFRGKHEQLLPRRCEHAPIGHQKHLQVRPRVADPAFAAELALDLDETHNSANFVLFWVLRAVQPIHLKLPPLLRTLVNPTE